MGLASLLGYGIIGGYKPNVRKSQMSTPLRVLLVEDSKGDANLIVLELQDSGYDPEFERVDTPEAFRAALTRQTWDVIICDYFLPRFSGLDALAMVKERELDLPFIIVSGVIGEDVAVAAMRSGAYDYVIKNNLARLGPAVQRALQEVEERRARRRAEEAQRQQRVFLQQVVDINPHFIFAKDREGRFTLGNEAFARAYGTTVEELPGKTDADFNPNRELVERYRQEDLAVIESKQELVVPEDSVVNSHGQELWRHTIKRPIVDEDGQVRQVVGVVIDITDLKRVQQSLAEARDQALEASRLKSQLLANVSHDLRTPLGAILGHTEMLQAGVYGPLSEQQYKATTRIVAGVEQLLGFIRNLLGQAQIEAGKIVLNFESFTPAELLETIRTTTNMLAQAKGVDLISEVAPDMPAAVSGDFYWLRQILANLVSNAIKFTEQGMVRVHIYQADDVYWAIQVSDTGCGIPPEAQSYIFEPFRQVDESGARGQRTGSGLGLSIVKQLTTLMGGKITLTSEVGEGSAFTVLLPLKPLQEIAA
jgi:PAS domain S-box-containing protein